MPAALLSHLLYGNRESVDRQKRINSILPMLFACEAQMNKQYVFYFFEVITPQLKHI